MTDLEAIALAILGAEGIPAVAELIEGVTRPVVLVAASGGPPATSRMPDWLTRGDLQIDVWATTKAEAWDLCGEIRTALLAAPRNQPTVEPPAVVTSATMTTPSWVPDSDWPSDGRPGPRYTFTATLTAHPKE